MTASIAKRLLTGLNGIKDKLCQANFDTGCPYVVEAVDLVKSYENVVKEARESLEQLSNAKYLVGEKKEEAATKQLEEAGRAGPDSVAQNQYELWTKFLGMLKEISQAFEAPENQS